MNLQEKPPEVVPSPCPACGARTPTPGHEGTHSFTAAPAFDRSALVLLESENSGLRRLVVDLIEKNQQLRDQLQAQKDRFSAGAAADLRLLNGRIAS
jgi:hypothetical protein